MSKEYQFYDSVTIRSDGYIITKKCADVLPRKKVEEKSLQNLKNNRVKGKLSESNRRILRKILDNWIASVYYYRWKKHVKFDNSLPLITAITLTLPAVQILNDYEVKKDLLSVYFTYLKRYHGVKHYFWKAEKQTNGSIHFHCLIDRFVPYEKINKYWNESLERKGYLNDYFLKYGNKNPPSARIEKLRSKTKAISYFIKYALKDDENGNVEGRVYGLSDELRKLKSLSIIVTREIAENLKKSGVSKQTLRIKEKYYSFYRAEVYNILKNQENLLSAYYTSYLSYVFDSLYFSKSFDYNQYIELVNGQDIIE